MSIRNHLYVVMFVGLLVFVGCKPSATDVKPKEARLSAAEAIRIARQTAEGKGINLRDYKQPEADFTDKDKTWSVFFEGRTSEFGNHFSIFVNDRNGEVKFRGGM